MIGSKYMGSRLAQNGFSGLGSKFLGWCICGSIWVP